MKKHLKRILKKTAKEKALVVERINYGEGKKADPKTALAKVVNRLAS